MKIDELKVARIKLAAFIRKCEPFDGKFFNKLSDENARALHQAREAVGPELAFQFKTYAPEKVTLEHARKLLSDIEEDILTFDVLETDPEIKEWAEIMNRLAEIEKSFRSKGISAFDAKRLGLVRGTVNW